jgi:ribosomal protein L5
MLLMSNRLLVERLCGQKLIFVATKKHHPAFNIAKDTQFGGMVTCRSDKLFLFFTYFMMYSLRNIHLFGVLNRKYLKTLRNFTLNQITFGLNKLLFFVMLSIGKDWDTFSYIYDGASYGMDLSIRTSSNNVYINKVILSHFGLNLI